MRWSRTPEILALAKVFITCICLAVLLIRHNRFSTDVEISRYSCMRMSCLCPVHVFDEMQARYLVHGDKPTQLSESWSELRNWEEIILWITYFEKLKSFFF